MSIPAKYDNYAKKTTHFNFTNTCHNKDRLLYDKVLAEGYNNFGVPMVYYVVSYDTTQDEIFGEDNVRNAERKFSVMAYYELPREEELWTKFGIEGIDNFHMYLSKKSFEAESTTALVTSGAYSLAFSSAFDRVGVDNDNGTLVYDTYPSYIPKVGDIIKAEYNDYYYEIVDVGEESEMFLQSKHSWDFIVRPYKDEHVTVSGTLSGDDLSNFTSQDDMLEINDVVDTKKDGVLYEPPGTEEDPNDPFGTW